MSFWFPKRDKSGRWSLYSVNVPIPLLFLALCFLTLALMWVVSAVARLFR